MAPLGETLLSAGRTLCQGVMQLVYPRVCWVCQQYQPMEQGPICDSCAAQLTQDSRPTCPRCASTVGPFVELAEGCTACRDSKFAFDRAFRLGPYEGLLREAVLRMKHRQGEGLAEIIADFWAERMAAQLQPLAPDLVLAVPLHWLRLCQRGYNPSEVLARSLARRLRLPCRSNWLRRRKRTLQQKTFEPAQSAKRWDNVRGAFAARPWADVAGKTLIIVDDVLTTGATASETARPLRALKPRGIIIAVLAHGR